MYVIHRIHSNHYHSSRWEVRSRNLCSFLCSHRHRTTVCVGKLIVSNYTSGFFSHVVSCTQNFCTFEMLKEQEIKRWSCWTPIHSQSKFSIHNWPRSNYSKTSFNSQQLHLSFLHFWHFEAILTVVAVLGLYLDLGFGLSYVIRLVPSQLIALMITTIHIYYQKQSMVIYVYVHLKSTSMYVCMCHNIVCAII